VVVGAFGQPPALRVAWPADDHLRAQGAAERLTLLAATCPATARSGPTYLRVRTTDGTLLAGLFASRSYAAGFPNDPDLLLEKAWSLKDDGQLDEPLGYPLYVAKGQIAWLEIVPPQDSEEAE